MDHKLKKAVIMSVCILNAGFVFTAFQGCSDTESSTVSISDTEKSAKTETSDNAETSDAELSSDQAELAVPPEFSAESGFYDSEFELNITADEGAKIYYTLDGSTPTAESLKWTEPLIITDRSSEPNVLSKYTDIALPVPEPPKKNVDKATVVRAVAIDKNGYISPVISRTYFVGFGDKKDYYRNLKIVSLITDESGLFDNEEGIYVLGKTYNDWLNGDSYDPACPEWSTPANYKQSGKEWERKAAIEIFEKGKTIAAQNVGIRIHGGATRSYPQKSFNVYARTEYGAAKMECDLFSGAVKNDISGSPITEYDTFMLRNGGNDAMYARFRDRLNQELSSGRAFLTQGMEQCIVFLNGEFWGQYDITEKMDNDFIKAHYDIPKKDVCIIKKEELDEGNEAVYEEWKQLWNKIKSADYSDPAAYEELCEDVDMQSFMDYVSCEIFIANGNWGKSNMAMWKSSAKDESNPYADGKWRFIMFDTEFSTGIYGEPLPTEDSFAKLMDTDCFLSDMFKAALKNETFRKQFGETFMDIADNNFSSENISAQIDELEKEYQDTAADTLSRFWSENLGTTSAEDYFTEQVDSLRGFYEKRYESITKYLKETIN